MVASHARSLVLAAIANAIAVATVARRVDAQATRARETPPRLTRFVEAVYPPEALRRGERADVVLEIDVDGAGRVTTVRVAVASGQGAFDEAAVAAAREFEFEPARRNGRSVDARIRYRYRFRPPSQTVSDEDAPRPASTGVTTPGAVATGAGTTNPATTATAAATAAAPTSTAGTGATSTTAATATARTRPTGTATTDADASASANANSLTVYGRAPSREIGRREFNTEEIQRIPGVRGDALLAIQNLPGVARPPFGIGQFIVRSSAPEDSLVTLEGQPIVLPFHFGGFASTVATDLIERIEFLPGNFSTRYGRVAGGVINITLRAPQRDRFHTAWDFDLIDLGAFASVPLGRRASLAVGFRRSLVDLIMPIFFGGAGGTSFRQFPFYLDYQLVFDWDIGPRDSLRVVASGSDDQLIVNFRDPNANDPNLRGNFGTHLGFHGVQARWRHRFSSDVTHTFAPSFGYNLTQGQVGPEVNFTFVSYVANLRDELEMRLSRNARLFVGTDSQFGFLDNDVRAPPVPVNGIADPINRGTVVSYRDRRAFANPSAYIEAEVDATSSLRLLAGVRVDYLGILNAVTLNPRSSLRWALGDRAAIRFGAGLYSTPPRGFYVVPGFGNPDLDPEHWQHYTAGLTFQLIPGAIEFDTDVFVKLGDHVVAISPRTILRNGEAVLERFANTGLGRVIGGEWMLRVRPGRAAPIYALLSYTHQRSIRAPCDRCAWTTYQYDQPHILSATLGAILPAGWEIGARFRFTSGTVEPTVTGALFDADHDVSLTLTDPTTMGRLPPYVSLDLRASKRFNIGPLRAQLILEVLNTTNSNNAESRIYSYDRRTSALVYGLPIIPSIGLRAEY